MLVILAYIFKFVGKGNWLESYNSNNTGCRPNWIDQPD